MIEVISAGVFTTIQDQGRLGFRNSGVPLSGVMDRYLSLMANSLVANSVKSAVLEMCYLGPVLKFHNDAYIAIAAGEQSISLNDKIICENTVHKVNKGDLLKLGLISKGTRSYLAVAGGFQSKSVLNSQSYYQGVTSKTKITKADILKAGQLYSNAIRNRSVIKLDDQHFENTELEVYEGPEFDTLTNELKAKLLRKKYQISPQSNRMAYKFKKSLHLGAVEIITSSVQPGTLQLTPSGDMIVLMRDCQTTGGYARVLQLSEKSINQLSQKPADTEVSFKLLN